MTKDDSLDKINNNLSKTLLGHYWFECMKKNPDTICHIDAATGEEETRGSVLTRSIRLAKALQKLGLKPGDVLAFGGNNHLDIHIPFYAALLCGLPIIGIDPLYKFEEIKSLFKKTSPTVVFCQADRAKDYIRAIEALDLQTRIVTFKSNVDDKNSTMGKLITMDQLIEMYSDDEPIEDFQPATFDADEVFAWLLSTSGSTGIPKVAAFKHSAIMGMTELCLFLKSHQKLELTLNNSPVQWISSYLNVFLIPIINGVNVQTSAPMTTEHLMEIINKYKPQKVTLSPAVIASILLRDQSECDLTCFNLIVLTGSKIHKELIDELRTRVRPDTKLLECYGQTETVGVCLLPTLNGPRGSCGTYMPCFDVKLVDPETGKEVTEPMVPGEMYVKTDIRFSEYYNDPEATAAAFTEDGWYKTGDLLYRDEDNCFFYVDRIKMLIKCRGYSMVPAELEAVIIGHEGVLEVSVTSVPHPEDCERAVACVVRKPGYAVTAPDIKDLVVDKLSETKALQGGVVFLEELPHTSTGKVARAKVKEIALVATKE